MRKDTFQDICMYEKRRYMKPDLPRSMTHTHTHTHTHTYTCSRSLLTYCMFLLTHYAAYLCLFWHVMRLFWHIIPLFWHVKVVFVHPYLSRIDDTYQHTTSTACPSTLYRTRMNESCHTWVMSHVWMIDVTHESVVFVHPYLSRTLTYHEPLPITKYHIAHTHIH